MRLPTNTKKYSRKNVLIVTAVFALVGSILLLKSLAATKTIIDEGFSSRSTNFQIVSGGKWSVKNGVYVLTKPSSSKNSSYGNGNIAVDRTIVKGDFNLTVNASTTPTAEKFNDFSIIFNFRDVNNYYFASFNETANDYTNGIFRIVNGTQTKLASFAKTIIPGKTYLINVVREGDTYTVSRDGLQVAKATDSALKNGKVGFGTRNDGAIFDNLKVNVADTKPPTADSSLLFYGSFETGNLSQWMTNQSCPDGVTVVSSPFRAGKYAAKFTVDDTDTSAKCPAVPSTGNPRAQLVSKPLFKNGSEAYVGTSIFLPAGFPTNVPANAFQVSELYGAPYGGGPVIGTYIAGDKMQLQISYKDDNDNLIYYRPWTSSTANTIGTAWQDITLHVKFSPDKNVGFIELWYNGKKQSLTDINGAKTQTFHLATLVKGVNWNGNSTDTNSLYINSYRKKGNILKPVTLYQDEAKVGNSYASVQP